MQILQFLNGPPDHTKIITIRRPRPILRSGYAPGWYGHREGGLWWWLWAPAGCSTHYLPRSTPALPLEYR